MEMEYYIKAYMDALNDGDEEARSNILIAGLNKFGGAFHRALNEVDPVEVPTLDFMDMAERFMRLGEDAETATFLATVACKLPLIQDSDAE